MSMVDPKEHDAILERQDRLRIPGEVARQVAFEKCFRPAYETAGRCIVSDYTPDADHIGTSAAQHPLGWELRAAQSDAIYSSYWSVHLGMGPKLIVPLEWPKHKEALGSAFCHAWDPVVLENPDAFFESRNLLTAIMRKAKGRTVFIAYDPSLAAMQILLLARAQLVREIYTLALRSARISGCYYGLEEADPS